jgi:catechol 2,3-dioxygenase-like lactoylglutathione lyase family enzyme
MSKLLKLDNIMYKVSDLDKAAKLYIDVLGLKQLWKDDNTKMIGLGMESSNAEIVLHANPKLPDFDFSYSVENVDSFIEKAIKNGLILTFGPIDVRTGKYAVLEDLDHNKIPIIDLTKFGGVPRYD